MFKLDLEKAAEPEIQLPTSTGLLKKQEFQKNIYFSFIDYAKAFDCVDHNKLWKILQEMRIPDHLTCLQRNLYTGQEATARTVHGTTDLFQIGKAVCQGCILSPCLFNLYAEYSMWNAGLDEVQAGIKMARRNINTSGMEMTLPYGRKQRRTKEPLDESERGEWKSWLKTQHSENKDLGIQSCHFIGNRCGNSGISVRLYFSGLQNHYSHEIRGCLLLGRKTMINLDSILKSRDITLPTKVHLVKAMFFFQQSCVDVRVGV